MNTNTLPIAVLAFFAACVLLTPVRALSAPTLSFGDGHRAAQLAHDYAEDRAAQNKVFTGHDGHIGPPTPQDWARYHAAETKLNAERPLLPCPERQDKHRRHRH